MLDVQAAAAFSKAHWLIAAASDHSRDLSKKTSQDRLEADGSNYCIFVLDVAIL